MTVWTGTAEETAPSSVWDGTQEQPASITAMPYGYASAAAMLAAAPFQVAHRGASLDWGEMTTRGMTESAARGVGALEISFSRSKDGVWFGMHDETFNRTSGGVSTAKGSDLTWAQIQGIPNFSDRYYTMDELVKPWAKSHVLFVDPKYQHSTYRAEFFTKLLALTDASRLVLKYYGDNTGLADAARSRGIKSWGYFYQDDLDSGMFDRCAGSWDILGFPYTGSAAGWERILAKGKPAIAHIIPTRSGYERALSLGATGAMLSGVRAVVRETGL